MTLKRIAFAALVLAAALLPLRRPAEPTAVTSPLADRTPRIVMLATQLRAAELRWSAFAERDSALAVIGTTRTAGGLPHVALQGFPAGATAPDAEAEVGRLWTKLGPTDSSVGIAVVAYESRLYSNGGYTGTLLTRHAGRDWCVAIVAGHRRATGDVLIPNHLLDAALAPCAVRAAFGPPGATVAGWLSATRYVSAQSVNWLSGIANDPLAAGPWAAWYDDNGNYHDAVLHTLIGATGAMDMVRLLTPPYQYGAPGLRCIAGDGGSCVTGVLHPAIMTVADRGVPDDLTLGSLLLQPRASTMLAARPASGTLLSALITDGGRDKFRNFWQSNRPFETAFQAAFGESLGAWTARWAKREWQATFDAKYRSADIILGVTLRPLWLLITLGWTGLALFATSWVARRRQLK